MKNNTSPSLKIFKRIGFLRVLNEENTMIPCLLSVAPVLDHILICWSDTEDRSIELARECQPHIEGKYDCKLTFLQYPHHVVPPHSVADLRKVAVENRIDTYLNFGLECIKRIYQGQHYAVSKMTGIKSILPGNWKPLFHKFNVPMIAS